MITIDIDAAELVKAINNKNLPMSIEKAQVTALNEYGEGLTNQIARSITEQTGFAESEVRSQFIRRFPATLALKVYEIRVKQNAIEEQVTSRGPVRDFLQRAQDKFEGRTLVDVVTAKDDAVCPICKQISEEGPYTVDETKKLRERHPHFLNRDLNCRCALAPFSPKQRVNVQMRTGKGVAPLDLSLTMRQLAEAVAKETRRY